MLIFPFYSNTYISTERLSGAVREAESQHKVDIRAHYYQFRISILDNILCKIQGGFQHYEQLMFLFHLLFQTLDKILAYSLLQLDAVPRNNI